MLRSPLWIAILALLATPTLAQGHRPGAHGGPVGPPAGGPHAATTGEWTGYITDTHCALKGANKDHTAKCVEMCMKGGSKAQILNEADNVFYDLDSFEKVKSLVGNRVTLKGALEADGKTIIVQDAAKAAAAPLP